MHDLSIVLTCKDVAGTAHIGCELINLINVLHHIGNHLLVAQIANDELVGWRFFEFVGLQVDGPDPVPFRFQPFHHMSTDEATGPID
jgi:hypothetical protein